MDILVVAVVLLQDQTAEETFKKIEEQIEKAKTVSVKFQCEARISQLGREEVVDSSGTLLLKEGNKARIELKSAIGDAQSGTAQEVSTLISDGLKMKGTFGLKIEEAEPLTSPLENKNTPVNLKSSLVGDLTRVGTITALELRPYVQGENPVLLTGDGRVPNLAIKLGILKPFHLDKPGEKVFKVFDFKAGQEDKGAHTLTYGFKLAGRDKTGEVKLWYDPKSHRILKRTVSFEIGLVGSSGFTTTETYEEFVLNADIPDERFKLPAEK